MQPAPAVTISAPVPSITASSLECLIGETMMLASAAVAAALDERSRGRVSRQTSQQGGDLLVQLYALRQVCVNEGLDFDHIARTFGKCAMLDEMIGWPLALLGKIVRTRMH